MSFNDREFQDLISGTRGVPSGHANDVELIIYMESPLYQPIMRAAQINEHALRMECDKAGVGYPKVTITLSPEVAQRIYRSLRQEPSEHLGTRHVLIANGLTIHCSVSAQPSQYMTLGTFSNDQASQFIAKAAQELRELCLKLYGDQVLTSQAAAPAVEPVAHSDFSKAEFADLVDTIAFGPATGDNEAQLVLQHDSPIAKRVDMLTASALSGAHEAAAAGGPAAPLLKLDTTSFLRKRIERHYGARSGGALMDNRHAVAPVLSESHRLTLDGLALYCAPSTWAMSNGHRLGVFNVDQAKALADKLAEMYRSLPRQSAQAAPAADVRAPSQSPASPATVDSGTFEHEAASLILDGDTIRLPSFTLQHYAKLKDLMVRAGGRYKQNAFVFKTPDQAMVAYDAVSSRRDLRKETQYFGTSEDVAELAMCAFDATELRGARTLEPSAGEGALADKLLQHGASEVVAIESWSDRAQTLRHKGHYVLERDFLSVTPDETGLFNIVLMNPPFSKGQDIDHVSHALSFLEPNGKLSAIMSANAGQPGRDARTKAFHKLLSLLDDPVTDIPAGAFKHCGTSVATINVRISMQQLLDRMRTAGVSPEELGLDLQRQMRGSDRAAEAPPASRRARATC